MSIRKAVLATMVVGSLVTMPTLAQAQQATPASVNKLSIRAAQIRHGATLSKKNSIAPTTGALIALAVAGAGVGIGFAVSDNKPKSP